MAATQEREELDAILRTIRDVEESLERRLTRASGVNLMIWGLVSGSIFLFYQLVEWNSETYEAALGPALRWVWLVPIAMGYVASALVATRMGRFGTDAHARRKYRMGLVPGVLATLAAAGLIAVGRGELIAGVLLAGLGVFFLLVCDRTTTFGRAGFALGVVNVAGGLALLALQPGWMSLAAALVMGGGLLAMGTWIFATAR